MGVLSWALLIKALGWLKKKEDEATVNQFLVSGHCNATTVTRAGGLLIVNCNNYYSFFHYVTVTSKCVYGHTRGGVTKIQTTKQNGIELHLH